MRENKKVKFGFRQLGILALGNVQFWDVPVGACVSW